MWKSIHMFIHDLEYQDRFIVDYLSDLLIQLKNDKLIKKYFFIRYWQGGPHIRLRYISNNELLVKNEVEKMFNEFKKIYKPKNKLDKDKYINKTKSNKELVEELYWYEDGTLKEIEYKPELNRYGGKTLIDKSEDIFMYSTNFVMEVLPKVKDNLNKKIIVALDLMNISLDGINEKERFILMYYEFWKEFNDVKNINYELVNKIQEIYTPIYYSMRSGECRRYYKYRNMLSQILNEIDRSQIVDSNQGELLSSILASHIHMANNRLGIPPYYEHILANVIYRIMKEY